MSENFQINQNQKNEWIIPSENYFHGFFPQILQILQIRQHPITYDLIYLGKFMGTNLQINQS